MNNMNFFDMFNDVEVEVKKEEKQVVKKETAKKATKKVDSKKGDKKEEIKKEPVLSHDEKIEKECAKYSTIVVKYFTSEVFRIEDKSEIENIKLNDIKNKLINEYNYTEFEAIKLKWQLAGNEEKKIAYLLPIYDLMNKG